MCSAIHATWTTWCAGATVSPQTVQKEIENVLRLLQAKGYVARSQVVWGQSSANLPYAWESESPSELYLNDARSSAMALATFQVCSCWQVARPQASVPHG